MRKTSGWNSLDAENVLGEDERVVPREEPVSFARAVFPWTVPPESVCVLRLHDRIKRQR